VGVPKIRWIYTGLRVRELPRSIRFYAKLGFRIAKRGRMEHGGSWVELAIPHSTHRLELNYYPPGTRFYERISTGTEFDHFGFEVDGIEEWAESLRRRRLPIVADFDGTTHRLVYVRDPDGNWIEFYGSAAPTRGRRRRVA
jgi:catechol 2,3-dioxygenase-like lactoylglutathione lyase family enzyme